LSQLKKLAGQTAIYGLASIIGRLAYFLLTPLHTKALDQSEFGTNTEIYSWIAMLTVVLTLGMETTYFRFSSKKDEDENRVFSRAYTLVVLACLLLLTLILPNQNTLLTWMRYPNQPEYLWLLLSILIGEVLSALPYARLRHAQRPVRFALIRLVNIGLNIGLNLYFFKALPLLGPEAPFQGIDNPVLYIFYANAVAVGVQWLLHMPQLKGFTWVLQTADYRKMALYGLPIMLAGLPGVINEVFDRQLLKYLLPEETSMETLGVYGAVFRLSVFIALFIQAYKYAVEPFFFGQSESKNAPKMYAQVMEILVLILVLAVLFLSTFLDLIKHFIDEKFWVGLPLVPLLFVSQMLTGVLVNLNIWYKISDKTRFGVYITLLGAVVSVGLNVLLIPSMGYWGAAIAAVATHAVMVVHSYVLSQKHHPIPYATGKILALLAFAAAYSALLCVPTWLWIFKILFLLIALSLLAYWQKTMLLTLLKTLPLWKNSK